MLANLKKNNPSNLIISRISSFVKSLSLSLLIVFLLSNNTYAYEQNIYRVSISTKSGANVRALNLTPVAKTFIYHQELKINSDNPNGVRLFISAKDAKTDIVIEGDQQEQEYRHSIVSTPGTIDNPSALNVNSFGFAISKDEENPFSANFSEDSDYYSINKKDIYDNAKFSRIGTKDNLTEIYRNNSNLRDKKIIIHYGLKLNHLIGKGNGSIDILYTIIPNLVSETTNQLGISDISNSNPIEIPENINIIRHYINKYSTKGQYIDINLMSPSNIQISDNDIKSGKLLLDIMVGDKKCPRPVINGIPIVGGNEGNAAELKMPFRPISLGCFMNSIDLGKYDLRVRLMKKSPTLHNDIIIADFIKRNSLEIVEEIEMSNFNHSICKSMKEHEIKIGVDRRISVVKYRIAKLKDGRCWMVEDLKLSFLNGMQSLDSSNTDIEEGYWNSEHNTRTIDRRKTPPEAPLFSLSEKYSIKEAGYSPIYYSYNSAKIENGSICPKGWKLPSLSEPRENDRLGFDAGLRGYGEFNVLAMYYRDGGYDGRSQGNLFIHDNIPGFFNVRSYDGRIGNLAQGGYWATYDGYPYPLLTIFPILKSKRSFEDMRRDRLDLFKASRIRCILRESSEVSDIRHMQDFTSQMCTNMTEHQTATLTDKRDNQQYTIAKLKDGKCWMIQNLRLKLSTSTTLTPADTDIASNWTPPRSTKENSGSGGNYGQGGDERWDYDGESYKTVRSIYRTPTYNTHGVYYTHSAVTAQSANGIDSDGRNAPHSICPKGWRLPTSSNIYKQGEFWNLAKAYQDSMSENSYYFSSSSNSSTIISGTPSFPLSGYYVYGGYFGRIGSYGYFWSSTVSSSDGAYNLSQNSSNLYPHNTDNRYYGFSARCVAR